jgi:hypothetical protein
MTNKLTLRLRQVSAKQWVNYSGWGMIIAAGVLLLVAWTWSRAAWLPSLTCNLATTGVAILVINRVVASAAEREQATREEWRQHRKQLRHMNRVARRRQMMRPEAGYPVAASLSLGGDLIDVALASDLSGAMSHLADKKEIYLEHARGVGHFQMVYGRFLTFREVGAVESVRRIISPTYS